MSRFSFKISNNVQLPFLLIENFINWENHHSVLMAAFRRIYFAIVGIFYFALIVDKNWRHF